MPHRQTCEHLRCRAKRRHSDHGGFSCVDLGTNRPSACGMLVGGYAFSASGFCTSVARWSVVELSLDGLSNCRDLTGKSALDQARCRSSGVIVGAVAASWSAGRVVDPMSPKFKLVSAGIPKWGASFLTTDVLTASANALSGRSHEP